ncbi:hypothetical protein [Streptomyces sp. NPDC087437]|uniref:hypothetical protein n=1 Tax=Streptomyces sp. NPDC087437 TaxID=3365789 RepID=UPI00380FA510
MPAATATQWLTAAGIGTAAFAPGALLILGLDHDLTPRLPHVDLEPAQRAAQQARTQVAAWLIAIAIASQLEQPKEATR